MMTRFKLLCGALLLSFVTMAATADAGFAKKKGDDCCAPPPVCTVYKPCVEYKGCLDCCGPKVQQVLVVKNPRDCCCAAEVPVCLPACCSNPCVSSRCALFGRSIVKYEYDCGVCVTVMFRKCGDVVVTYRG